MDSSLVPVSEIIPQYLQKIGVDYTGVLRRLGIAAATSGGLLVTPEQYFAMWRMFEEAGVPRDFGFDIVTTPDIPQFDVASIAALHAPTLREALATLARYHRLTCNKRIHVQEVQGEATIHLSWIGVKSTAPSMLIDCAFSWLLKLGSLGLGEMLVPVRVELARREHAPELLRRRFGCGVVFNAARDALVLSVPMIDRAFVTHNAPLLETMMPGLEAAFRKHSGPITFSDRVKAVILERMQGKRPSIEDLASEFGMGARTLQRHLENAGTSYQRLLDEVRRETATRLLSSTDLDPGTVGFILGFEELNSFTRAFQGWEGMTPSRWRKAQEGAMVHGDGSN